jgi:hypothetical protein
MKRLFTVLVLSALVVVPATALAAKKKHHVTDHLVGNVIRSSGSTTVYAGSVVASDAGNGAATLTNTATSATAGTTRGVSYFSNGSVRSSGNYKVNPVPLANGDIAVTSAGRITGGTGRFKGVSGTYTASGVQDPKTGIVTLTVKATD